MDFVHRSKYRHHAKGLFVLNMWPEGPSPIFLWEVMGSLRRSRNSTSVSNVCKAAPRSLFWASNGLNELLEVGFEFPFILIGKSTIAF